MVYISQMKELSINYCKCGCGSEISQDRLFVSGHNSKGRVLPAETREKIRKANTGRSVSQETRNLWHKQRQGNTNSRGCKRSAETKNKISSANSGKKRTPDQLERLRALDRRGVRNANWRGGSSGIPHLIRTSFLYRQWRSDIFTRDGYSCTMCGDAKGHNLCAHHKIKVLDIIKEYNIKSTDQAMSCEKLWDINNGTTLCKDCHIKIHSKGCVQ